MCYLSVRILHIEPAINNSTHRHYAIFIATDSIHIRSNICRSSTRPGKSHSKRFSNPDSKFFALYSVHLTNPYSIFHQIVAINTNYQEEKPAQSINIETPILSSTVRTTSSSAVTTTFLEEEEQEPYAYELQDMHGALLKSSSSTTRDESYHYLMHSTSTKATSSSLLMMQRDKILFIILTFATIIIWGILAFQLLGFRSISSEAVARPHRRQFYSLLPDEQ